MKTKVWVLVVVTEFGLSGSFAIALCANRAVTQVVPDQTLPVGERSVVTDISSRSPISDGSTAQIEGGARRGGNLFHSFSEFSVPTGGTVYFNNAMDVQNIFSRITGNSASRIDGLIRTNGSANLFLLNPNGILFGQNASLNVGGSFVATTANSINYADGFQYSAPGSQTPPLLTISTPIGLQLGQNPGVIRVQGAGSNLLVQIPAVSPLMRGSLSSGLQVTPRNTLALVGGAIEIEGGTLTTEQGRIELGGVRAGQVTLSFVPQGLALSYQNSQNFEDK